MNRILSLQNVGLASAEETMFNSTDSNNCSSETSGCTGVTTQFEF